MCPSRLTGHVAERLHEATVLFGRDPETYLDKDEEAGGDPHLAVDE